MGRCVIRLALFLVLTAWGAVEGMAPFLNPRGQCSLYLGYEYYSTEHFWNDQGERQEAFNEFTRHRGEVYSQYGLTVCDSLFGIVGYSKIAESLNGDTSGPEDVQLGCRHWFKATPTYVVLGDVSAIIPAAKYKPALRYGRFGGQASLQYTYYFNLCDHYGFATARLGYRGYSGFPSDQLRSNLAIGWNFCDIAQIQVAGILEYGLFNGNMRRDASNIAYNPNYRLFKTDVTAMIYLYRGCYLIGGLRQHLWGRNVGTGATYYGGIDVHF